MKRNGNTIIAWLIQAKEGIYAILSYIEKVLIYSHFLVEDIELHRTLFSSFLFHEKSI